MRRESDLDFPRLCIDIRASTYILSILFCLGAPLRAAKAADMTGASHMHAAKLIIRSEEPSDLGVIAEIASEAFGPGRFARTAYRVREGITPVAALSLSALLGERLVASIRFTAIAIGGTPGGLLLGPLVVHPGHAGQGHGTALIEEGLKRAKKEGFSLVLLVGDMPYYGRFGFKPVPPGSIVLPGPVDPARLLALELEPGTLDKMSGHVRGLDPNDLHGTR